MVGVELAVVELGVHHQDEVSRDGEAGVGVSNFSQVSEVITYTINVVYLKVILHFLD